MWRADVSEPLLFEAPGPPAWTREESFQGVPECLSTCYNTVPAHTSEVPVLRKTKLVMRLEEVGVPSTGGPCYFILCVLQPV